MGVSLIIKRLNDPVFETLMQLEACVRELKSQGIDYTSTDRLAAQFFHLNFEVGRFQDDYGPTHLLATLGMDYQTAVVPLRDEKMLLTGEKLVQFRDAVASARQVFPEQRQIEARFGRVDEHGRYSLARWHRFFYRKKRKLLRFLNLAIMLDTPVEVST